MLWEVLWICFKLGNGKHESKPKLFYRTTGRTAVTISLAMVSTLSFDRKICERRQNERQLAERRTTKHRLEGRKSCVADARSYVASHQFNGSPRAIAIRAIVAAIRISNRTSCGALMIGRPRPAGPQAVASTHVRS